MSEQAAKRLRARLYPESAAGGFSSVDGTIEFYNRVNALIEPDMVVLDFAAGRGAWAYDEPSYRRGLRMLRGKVKKVIGTDVDVAVETNPSLDEAIVIRSDGRLPFDDASFDLIVSDSAFEHIDDPRRLARELDRILKPGGWLCARTPNRWGYIGIGATLVPNRLHMAVLRRLQPGRKPKDVFPTVYEMNTNKRIEELFPRNRFHNHTYTYDTEPAYFGSSEFLWRLAMFMFRLSPKKFRAMLFVFLKKIGD